MNTKLYKTEKENYILVDPSKGTYDVGYLLGTSRDSQVNKLSIKNCQAIERGYDFNEIKRKLFGGFDGQPDSFTIAAVERTVEIMFEILSDKKFTLEDMFNLYAHIVKNGIISGEEANEFIQSLQQPTEIEVEIEVTKSDDIKSVEKDWYKIGEPKLDVDCCLTLKRT